MWYICGHHFLLFPFVSSLGSIPSFMPGTQQISPGPSTSSTAAQVVAFETKISFGMFLLHTLVQLAHISCPWSERWQRLLSIPCSALQFLIPAMAPSFYIKHRDMSLLATKLMFFSFPLLRKARGIQRALEAPAMPGTLGFVVDLAKMAWGSRLLAVCFSGILMPQSLLFQFLVQLYATTMVLGNSSLCTTKLMTDPLTLKRVSAFTTLSLNAFVPFTGVDFDDIVGPGEECRLLFNFMHIFFGILVPMLVVAVEKRARERQKSGKLLRVWIALSVAWASALMLTVIHRHRIVDKI